MAQSVSNAAPQPIPMSNLSSPSQGSSAGLPPRPSQQPSINSPSNLPQQSSNAGTPSSLSQPWRSPPSPPLQQTSNIGAPGNQNPQLLRPPPSNLSVSTISNTNASSSTVNSTNVLKPTSPTIPPTSQNPTPPASAASAYPAVPRYAFIENTLRAWSLGSLYEAGVKISNRFTSHRRRLFKKRDHITLFQHRGIALWASLLHLVPIAATATITYYMNTEYFVGNQLAGRMGTDKFKLLGLQFAAKVHELLMISTLTKAIFALVRHELSRGDGVPFAFLSAGLGVPKVSFLWSKDFVALCKAKYGTLYKKALFLGSILLCIFLCVAVGPVSATALTPVRRNWEAGGTKVWLSKTKEELFPEILDDVLFDNRTCSDWSRSENGCPSAGWRFIKDGYIPRLNIETRRNGVHAVEIDELLGVDGEDVGEFTIFSNGAGILFNVVASFGRPQEHGVWRSAVMAPHTAVTEALAVNEKVWVVAAEQDMKMGTNGHRFTERAGSSYRTTVVPLAAASTVCNRLYPDNPYPEAYRGNETDRKWDSGLGPWDDAIDDHINITDYLNWKTSAAKSGESELLFLDVPPNISKGTSLVAFISIVMRNDRITWGCNIDARWVYDSLVSTSARLLPKPSNNKWHREEEWANQNHTQINIRSSFAQLTNPILPPSEATGNSDLSNNTAFKEMLIQAGIWNRNTFRDTPWAFRLETVLNLMIVNGLARTAPGAYPYGKLWGINGYDLTPDQNDTRWWSQFMPKGAFGPGGDAYNLTLEEKENGFSFQMDMFAEGYGYSFRRSTASRVSITILLLQLAIASCFIIYTISTGTSSSSWDSPAELLALAFASEAPRLPADRKGLATGEASIESLKKLYCVEADGTRLQLKEWIGPRRVEEAKRVKPNTAYE